MILQTVGQEPSLESPSVPIDDQHRDVDQPSENMVVDAQETQETLEKPRCQMKFTIKQDDLLTALALVIKASSPATTLPVLAHVLVATHASVFGGMPTHVMLTCSNLETSISCWQCAALVEREGAFTIPAKSLLECVKSCSKGRDITVEVVESDVLVQCGKRVVKLKGGMEASEFPAWNEMVLGDGAPCTFDTDVLRQAIKEVQFAAADDDARPTFTAICTHIEEETLTLVGLDAYRMALRTLFLPTPIRNRDATLLVPVASLRLLAEVMPTATSVMMMWDRDKTRVVFQAGLLQLAARLVEGTFPKYQTAILKEHTTSFTVSRKDLDQIIKAFKPFAQDNGNIFKLSYHTAQGIVGCSAESEDLGEAYDEINVPIEGTDGQVIFNIRYLIDVLKHVSVEAFVFQLTKEDRPVLITPRGRQDCAFVVMPMSRNR